MAKSIDKLAGKLMARIRAMEAALKFYGDPDVYGQRSDYTPPVMADAGKIARKVLKGEYDKDYNYEAD